MKIEDFENIVKEAKELNPFWFDDCESKVNLEKTDIDLSEKENGVLFPIQYKEFLIRHGSGYFAFTNVLSPLRSGDYSMWVQKARYGLPDCFLPICDNECGDYYGFVATNGLCSDEVYWLDHESGYQKYEKAYDSFFEFVVKTGLKR